MRCLVLCVIVASAVLCTAAHAATPLLTDHLEQGGHHGYHPRAAPSLEQLEQQSMDVMSEEQRSLLEWAQQQSAAGLPAFPGGEADSGTAAHQRRLMQIAEDYELTTAPAGTTSLPTVSATMEELVIPKGYPLEVHNVTSEAPIGSPGAPNIYLLTMYRIPYGRYRHTERGPKPLVLLHHGVTLASSCFVIYNANESMAFILADAGFDVWMANSQINTYSRYNVERSVYEVQTLYTTIDTIALQNVPAQINYMLAYTGAKKTAFIGHSQGCTVAHFMLAALPEMNDKVSVVLHMGPVLFVRYFDAPVLRALAEIRAEQILKLISLGELFPNRFTAPIYRTLCQAWPLDELCATLVSLIFFGPSVFITPDDYYAISRTWPSSVNSRNLDHWVQLFKTNPARLQKYDFGTYCNNTRWNGTPRPYYELCNQQEYGQLTPPLYNITNITAPQAYFLGDLDLLSVSEDVQEQKRLLRPGSLVAEFLYLQYSHMDFIWDRNAKHKADMVDVMLRYAPGTY